MRTIDERRHRIAGLKTTAYFTPAFRKKESGPDDALFPPLSSSALQASPPKTSLHDANTLIFFLQSPLPSLTICAGL